jgi:hypothetical protein
MSDNTPSRFHPELLAVYHQSIEGVTQLIQKFRIDGRLHIVERLYEAADLLDAIDLDNPELTPSDLEATAQAVTKIYNTIQAELNA